MQLNALFDFLGRSFLPEGEEAAKIAEDMDRPAGFGRSLAAAFGLVSREGSTDSPKDRSTAAEAALVADDPNGSPSGMNEGSSSLLNESGKTNAASKPSSNLRASTGSSPEAGTAAGHAGDTVAPGSDTLVDTAPDALSAPDASSAQPSVESSISQQAAPPATEEPAESTSENGTRSSSNDTAATLRENEAASTHAEEGEATASTSTLSEASGSPHSPDVAIPDASDEKGASESPSMPAGPSAEPAPSGSLTTDNQRGHPAPGLQSTPATSSSEAPRNLPASGAAAGQPASNPVQTGSESTGPDPHASTEPEAASIRAEGLKEDRTDTGSGQDSKQTPSDRTIDTGRTQTVRVRAADLARAARHPSDALATRRGVEATATSTAETQPSHSETKSLTGGSSAPRLTASNTALPSGGGPGSQTSELPAGVESVIILEEGANADSNLDAPTRRAKSLSPTAIPNRMPSTASDETLPKGASPVFEEDIPLEMRSESDIEANAQAPSADGEIAEGLEAALRGSDDGVRRSSATRSDIDGDRKQSAKPQPAAHGDRPFSGEDSGRFSESRDQKSSFRGERLGTVESVSTKFETAVDDQLADDIGINVNTASEESPFTPEQKTTIAGATTDPVPGVPRKPAAGTLSWLRSMLAQSARSLSLEQGWKAIEVQLEKGLGTMTVRARRGEDGLKISVSFSDPQLKSLAEANVHRLQDMLRTEYEANVDLSLSSDGSSDTPGRRNQSEPGRSSLVRIPSTVGSEMNQSEAARSLRPATAGTRNEWFG